MHRNENAILTKSVSLAVQGVKITLGGARDENVDKMAFPFQWISMITVLGVAAVASVEKN